MELFICRITNGRILNTPLFIIFFKKITLIHAQVLLTAIFTPLIFFIGENFSHVNENEGSSSNLDISGLLVLSGIKIFNK